MNHASAKYTPPFFSICLTTFDRPELLSQTLGSILAQTFEDFEVIIGNNNVDNPLHLSSLGVSDNRIRIINHSENLGQCGNLNKLLKLSLGAYVTFIADDDLYHPNFLAAAKDALEMSKFPLCVFTGYELVYGHEKPNLSLNTLSNSRIYSGEQFLKDYLLNRVNTIGSMGLFERNYLVRSGGIEDISEDGVGLFEEYMLIIRAGVLDYVAYISEPLIAFRIHETSWGFANTELDRYYRAGKNLLRKSFDVLDGQYRGPLSEVMLLIFNLGLRQILNKAGQQEVRVDIADMMTQSREVLNTSYVPWCEVHSNEITTLLLQQFADAEISSIKKEMELWKAKDKDREILEKEQALLKNEQVLLEKEREIQELAKIIGNYNKIFSIPVLGQVLQILKRIRIIIQPRLGKLKQYPPRTLTRQIVPPIFKTAPIKPVKISIITPSYQQGKFIERTVVSVLNQEYINLEYFIQDGGSSDNTIEVIKRYEKELSGWITEEDDGQSQAINLGFKNTSGEIMAWLNSDDLLLPNTLAIVAKYFHNNPKIDVIYGNRLIIDENDMEIGRWILPGHDGKVLSWADYVPQETMFWRRRIWEKVGGKVDESFRFAMDWDLLIRFRDAGAKFAHIPLFLGAFRVHDRQKTSGLINEIGFQEMDRIRERLLGSVPNNKEVKKSVALFLLRHVFVDKLYSLKSRLGGKKL
ncbi:glycosyltransferase [Polynucleobacter sp.]|uniref:glycosyltransferase n=1 Tax=Polynucleobacter sp. TaxID=2029855 RepID=UPI003F6963DF